MHILADNGGSVDRAATDDGTTPLIMASVERAFERGSSIVRNQCYNQHVRDSAHRSAVVIAILAEGRAACHAGEQAAFTVTTRFIIANICVAVLCWIIHDIILPFLPRHAH